MFRPKWYYRIFTPVQPVVIAASEATWSNWLSHRSSFSKLSTLKCDVGWLKGLIWPLFWRLPSFASMQHCISCTLAPPIFHKLVSHLNGVRKLQSSCRNFVHSKPQKCPEKASSYFGVRSYNERWERMRTCRLKFKPRHFSPKPVWPWWLENASLRNVLPFCISACISITNKESAINLQLNESFSNTGIITLTCIIAYAIT